MVKKLKRAQKRLSRNQILQINLFSPSIKFLSMRRFNHSITKKAIKYKILTNLTGLEEDKENCFKFKIESFPDNSDPGLNELKILKRIYNSDFGMFNYFIN